MEAFQCSPFSSLHASDLYSNISVALFHLCLALHSRLAELWLEAHLVQKARKQAQCLPLWQLFTAAHTVGTHSSAAWAPHTFSAQVPQGQRLYVSATPGICRILKQMLANDWQMKPQVWNLNEQLECQKPQAEVVQERGRQCWEWGTTWNWTQLVPAAP